MSTGRTGDEAIDRAIARYARKQSHSRRYFLQATLNHVALVAHSIGAQLVTDSRLLNAQARQERVKLLLTRNLTLHEIAEAVGASLRTVNYDIKQIRQEAAATLSRSNVLDLAATMLLRSEARHRELWALFARTDAAQRDGLALVVAITLKLNLLKELARQTSRELDILIKLGIVIPAEKESMVGMKAVALLNSLPPSELELAVSQDTEHFVATLRRNFGDAEMNELFGEGWSLQAPSDIPGAVHSG